MWSQFNTLTKALTDQAAQLTEQATHAVRAAGIDVPLVGWRPTWASFARKLHSSLDSSTLAAFALENAAVACMK